MLIKLSRWHRLFWSPVRGLGLDEHLPHLFLLLLCLEVLDDLLADLHLEVAWDGHSANWTFGQILSRLLDALEAEGMVALKLARIYHLVKANDAVRAHIEWALTLDSFRFGRLDVLRSVNDGIIGDQVDSEDAFELGCSLRLGFELRSKNVIGDEKLGAARSHGLGELLLELGLNLLFVHVWGVELHVQFLFGLGLWGLSRGWFCGWIGFNHSRLKFDLIRGLCF